MNRVLTRSDGALAKATPVPFGPVFSCGFGPALAGCTRFQTPGNYERMRSLM